MDPPAAAPLNGFDNPVAFDQEPTSPSEVGEASPAPPAEEADLQPASELLPKLRTVLKLTGRGRPRLAAPVAFGTGITVSVGFA